MGAAGVLGLLGLAFVVLKTTETRQPRPVVAEQSTEWNIGFRSAEEAKGKGPLIAVVAVAVLVLVMGVLMMNWVLLVPKTDSLSVDTDETFAPDTP